MKTHISVVLQAFTVVGDKELVVRGANGEVHQWRGDRGRHRSDILLSPFGLAAGFFGRGFNLGGIVA